MTGLGAATRAFIGATFRSMLADRTNLFFSVVLPIAIITIIGASFGGAVELEVGVIGAPSELRDSLADELEATDSVVVELDVDLDDARARIRRFDMRMALVLPDDADELLASGQPVPVSYIVNETNADQLADLAIVRSALDDITLPSAAALAIVEADPGVAVTEANVAATMAAASLERTTVVAETVGDRGFTDASPFALTAAQNLVLFTFITSLTSATLLVRNRANGVLGRSFAAPVGSTAISIGLAATWFLVALLQSALIVVIGGAGFGVDWGDPIGAIVMSVMFALVGAGAGLLAGAVTGTEERLGAAAAPIGLVLGGLGGCMVPAEFFPDSIQNISRLTPHYWALDGWQTLIFDDGGLADLGQALLVLGGFAAGFMALGSAVLHRRLTSA